ncbi:hypothetical protein KK137_09895 [Croceibacterium sp. LX-88]|uniref:Uncharacterized protein n=1 Tax=Croceibacterium selenioxidans TaxID=2838833 RepID=A0ABS5W4G4_9SPHN|nr:hypothetical protein [Croceibacterium selenioxidans]MBT2134645.1 hypothetical protein [Croceibacterium selenioxidans]
MAISDDVRQIILILEEEGFGALAGEILTEISLGREVEKEDFLEDRSDKARAVETIVLRVPIEEPDQLQVAMDILRSRLVLPVRAFVEAERIASELVGDGQVRIGFIDPEQRTATPPISTRDVGDTSIADEFDALLTRLPNMIIPPEINGV